jgi:endonuclease/exonuclease/phosphatase family metal-dependent hydrolase
LEIIPMKRPLLTAILLAFLIITPALVLGQTTEVQSDPVRAMSFNIRLGVAKDGDNHWEKRKETVVQAITEFAPDFVGTQETYEFQAKYIGENLPQYTYVGRSRQRDGKGEQCGIFYLTKRFDKLVEGHFWLSETPDKAGSKSWDSSLPRMATWLKLWDKTNQSSFYVINTHFDHRGAIARKQSAAQIRKFVNELPKGSSVIVTGDFNAGANSAPYQAMFGDSAATGESPLLDSYAIKHVNDDEPSGTFNGFKGTADGARIDWIAVSRNISIESANIDRIAFDGRYPSDHFPVNAVLRLK